MNHEFTKEVFLRELKELASKAAAATDKDGAAFSPGRLHELGMLLEAADVYDGIKDNKLVQNTDTFLILMTAMLQFAAQSGHGMDDNDVRMMLTLAVVARTFFKFAEKEGMFEEQETEGAFVTSFDLASITERTNAFSQEHGRLATTMAPCVNIHNTLRHTLTPAQRIATLSYAIHNIIQNPDRKQGRVEAVEALVTLGSVLFGDLTDPAQIKAVAPPEATAKYRAMAAEEVAKMQGKVTANDIENMFKPQE